MVPRESESKYVEASNFDHLLFLKGLSVADFPSINLKLARSALRSTQRLFSGLPPRDLPKQVLGPRSGLEVANLELPSTS